MTGSHRGDPHRDRSHQGDPALWQPDELLADTTISGRSGPGDTPAPHPPADTDADADPGADGAAETDAGSAAEPVETQLAPGSLPAGPGRIALPVTVLGPRELKPYLARHPDGDKHCGHGVFAAGHDGRSVRGESGRWDYSAPGLRGWCRCGWTGPVHPQAPIPAEYQRVSVREGAWREINRAARRAIDGEWLDHVYVALPSLGLTVLHWQREIIERAVPAAVVHARRYGAPWQEVGDQTGMSRQSAHERWRNLDPPREFVTPSTGLMAPAAGPASETGPVVGPMCARCDHAEWAHEAFGFDHPYLAPATGEVGRARRRQARGPQRHNDRHRDGGGTVG